MPATIAHNLATGLSTGLAHALESWRHRRAARRAWRAEYARTVAELSTYTDRERTDLGIAEADIFVLARQQADLKSGRL